MGKEKFLIPTSLHEIPVSGYSYKTIPIYLWNKKGINNSDLNLWAVCVCVCVYRVYVRVCVLYGMSKAIKYNVNRTIIDSK